MFLFLFYKHRNCSRCCSVPSIQGPISSMLDSHFPATRSCISLLGPVKATFPHPLEAEAQEEFTTPPLQAFQWPNALVYIFHSPAPNTLSGVTGLLCVTLLQYVLPRFPQFLYRIKFPLNVRGNRLDNMLLIMYRFPVLLLHSATVFSLSMVCW